jgi:hypothetical protein
MSISIMSAVWKHRCNNHAEKLVLMSLADNANDQGVCWPALNTIAERCDLTKPGVIGIIARLQAGGLIAVKTGGGRRSNSYTLTIPEVNAVDPRGKRRLPQQATPLTPGVNAVDPNRNRTVMEPKEKLPACAAPAAELCHVEQPEQPSEASPASKPSPAPMDVPPPVVPGPVNGSAPAFTSLKGTPTPPLAVFVRLWCAAHEQEFGEPYVLTRGRDHARAKALLTATAFSPVVLVETARKAWKLPSPYLRQRAATIHGFVDVYGEIKAALRAPPPGGRDPANPTPMGAGNRNAYML